MFCVTVISSQVEDGLEVECLKPLSPWLMQLIQSEVFCFFLYFVHFDTINKQIFFLPFDSVLGTEYQLNRQI